MSSSSATPQANAVKRKAHDNFNSSDEPSVKKIMFSDMTNDQDKLSLFNIPRELRDRIYHFLWSGVKIEIRFGGMKMHIMYDGDDPYRSYRSTTELPDWFFVSKTIMAESLKYLYERGELLLTPNMVAQSIVIQERPRDVLLFQSSVSYPDVTPVLQNTIVPSYVIDPFQLRTLTLAMDISEGFSKNVNIAQRLNLKEYHREAYIDLVKYLAKHIRRGTGMSFKNLRIELYASVEDRNTSLHVSPYGPLQRLFKGTFFKQVEVLIKDPEEFNGSTGTKEPWFGQFKSIIESLLGPKYKLEEEGFYDDIQGVFTEVWKGTRKG